LVLLPGNHEDRSRSDLPRGGSGSGEGESPRRRAGGAGDRAPFAGHLPGDEAGVHPQLAVLVRALVEHPVGTGPRGDGELAREREPLARVVVRLPQEVGDLGLSCRGGHADAHGVAESAQLADSGDGLRSEAPTHRPEGRPVGTAGGGVPTGADDGRRDRSDHHSDEVDGGSVHIRECCRFLLHDSPPKE